MNITIEQLFEKIGRLHISQDLLAAENAALKEAQKVIDAVKTEVAKIEKEGETAVVDVKDAIARIKKFF